MGFFGTLCYVSAACQFATFVTCEFRSHLFSTETIEKIWKSGCGIVNGKKFSPSSGESQPPLCDSDRIEQQISFHFLYTTVSVLVVLPTCSSIWTTWQSESPIFTIDPPLLPSLSLTKKLMNTEKIRVKEFYMAVLIISFSFLFNWDTASVRSL